MGDKVTPENFCLFGVFFPYFCLFVVSCVVVVVVVVAIVVVVCARLSEDTHHCTTECKKGENTKFIEKKILTSKKEKRGRHMDPKQPNQGNQTCAQRYREHLQ